MALASERLLALLVREIAAFEADVAWIEDDNPNAGQAGATVAGGAAADAARTVARRRTASQPKAAAGAAGDARRMGPKERIEHIGQMAKVLVKLLELRRLETLAAAGGPQDDAEAARLGAELLSRLRSLDARRQRGELLFGPEAGADETAEASGGGVADVPREGSLAADGGDGALATERVGVADTADAADPADAAGGGR